MREAAWWAVRHALLDPEDGGLGLRLVRLRAAATNVASCRVAELVGFHRTGVEPAAHRLGDGTFVDQLRYQVRAEEPRRRCPDRDAAPSYRSAASPGPARSVSWSQSAIWRSSVSSSSAARRAPPGSREADWTSRTEPAWSALRSTRPTRHRRGGRAARSSRAPAWRRGRRSPAGSRSRTARRSGAAPDQRVERADQGPRSHRPRDGRLMPEVCRPPPPDDVDLDEPPLATSAATAGPACSGRSLK